jgi:hypothetical protein
MVVSLKVEYIDCIEYEIAREIQHCTLQAARLGVVGISYS